MSASLHEWADTDLGITSAVRTRASTRSRSRSRLSYLPCCVACSLYCALKYMFEDDDDTFAAGAPPPCSLPGRILQEKINRLEQEMSMMRMLNDMRDARRRRQARWMPSMRRPTGGRDSYARAGTDEELPGGLPRVRRRRRRLLARLVAEGNLVDAYSRATSPRWRRPERHRAAGR